MTALVDVIANAELLLKVVGISCVGLSLLSFAWWHRRKWDRTFLYIATFLMLAGTIIGILT